MASRPGAPKVLALQILEAKKKKLELEESRKQKKALESSKRDQQERLESSSDSPNTTKAKKQKKQHPQRNGEDANGQNGESGLPLPNEGGRSSPRKVSKDREHQKRLEDNLENTKVYIHTILAQSTVIISI
jgi:hypothetical protein